LFDSPLNAAKATLFEMMLLARCPGMQMQTFGICKRSAIRVRNHKYCLKQSFFLGLVWDITARGSPREAVPAGRVDEASSTEAFLGRHTWCLWLSVWRG
jgi:hypothetical protein